MVKIRIDLDKCDGCGTCVDVCPIGVFEMKDGKSIAINVDECLICKACETQCPNNAIKSSNRHGSPLLLGRAGEVGAHQMFVFNFFDEGLLPASISIPQPKAGKQHQKVFRASSKSASRYDFSLEYL